MAMNSAKDERKNNEPLTKGFALWGLKSFEETFVQGPTFVHRMNSRC
jgi:hypothetical protein